MTKIVQKAKNRHTSQKSNERLEIDIKSNQSPGIDAEAKNQPK